MKRQIDLFFCALMFYTRIPCPKWVSYSKENLADSVRYLPLVGGIVGFICATVFTLSLCVFSPLISAALSMIAGVLTTGAFHEDGLADVCDGFGGGWTKEKIMSIMKDSRVGAFGAAGMILVLLLKFAALTSLSRVTQEPLFSREVFFVLVIIAAHMTSRCAALLTMVNFDYVQEQNDSKAGPAAQKRLRVFSVNVLLPVMSCMVVLAFFQTWLICLPVLVLLLAAQWMGCFFRKWIGGYTGDCLGAIQQVTELIFYLGVIALWKCI